MILSPQSCLGERESEIKKSIIFLTTTLRLSLSLSRVLLERSRSRSLSRSLSLSRSRSRSRSLSSCLILDSSSFLFDWFLTQLETIYHFLKFFSKLEILLSILNRLTSHLSLSYRLWWSWSLENSIKIKIKWEKGKEKLDEVSWDIIWINNILSKTL